MPKVSNRDLVDAVYRSDLRAFIEALFPVYSPGDVFVPGWYINAIAHHLSEVAAGRIKRLIINIPPRYLKSYCASIAFPAWILGHDPTQQIMCVSYSNELSKKHANDFRSVVQSRTYKRIFPRMRLSRQKNTELEVETTRRGFRLATSTEGTVTGRGANIIIIDDPLSANDAHSVAAIDRVSKWFKSTGFSRLNNKETGAIVLVMQRLHTEDLSAELGKTHGWTVLSLPAIATADQVIAMGANQFHERNVGDVLHPERESYETLQDIKRTLGLSIFSAQYQQAPVPAEGQILDPAWLRYYDIAPARNEKSFVFLSMDTAAKTASTNDYSAIVAFQRQGDDYYILDVVRKRVPFPELRDLAVVMRNRHNASAVVIEDASSGIQLIQDLRATKVLKPSPWRAAGNKESRAYSIQTLLMAGRVHLPKSAPWLEAFVQEFASFPSRFDDQIDALTMGLLWDQQRKRVEIPSLGVAYESNRQQGFEGYTSFSLRNNGLPSEISHFMHGSGDVTVCGLGSYLDDEFGAYDFGE